MVRKIPCPACGEPNYETSPACWACNAPLHARPGTSPAMPPPAPAEAPAEPESLPDLPSVPAPPGVTPETAQVETLLETAPEAATPLEPSAPLEETVPPSENASTPGAPRGLKPAELEAQRLRDKEYITPPVDVEEKPRSLGDWARYAVAATVASVGGFKASLDEYDRRRGTRSGTMSSFGCLVTFIVAAIFIALLVLIVSLFAHPTY